MDHRSLLLATLALAVAYHVFVSFEPVEYVPEYPNGTVLNNFVTTQVELVNRHNRYELEHGFVPPDKINQTKQLCKVPDNESIIKRWWMDNTLLKFYYDDRNWNKLHAFCHDYSFLDSRICGNIISYGLRQQQFDSLMVAAKYCYVKVPRANPLVKIIERGEPRRNKSNQKKEIILTVEVSLPNGTKVQDIRDEKIKLTYNEYHDRDVQYSVDGCYYTILSNSQILMTYDEYSGVTLCDTKFVDNVHSDEFCQENYWSCQKETVCGPKQCSFSFSWNWTNPIFNSPNVSLWLIRSEVYQTIFNANYVDIRLD